MAGGDWLLGTQCPYEVLRTASAAEAGLDGSALPAIVSACLRLRVLVA